MNGVVPGRLHGNYREWGSRFGAKSRSINHVDFKLPITRPIKGQAVRANANHGNTEI
jgi:hypothetical protein